MVLNHGYHEQIRDDTFSIVQFLDSKGRNMQRARREESSASGL